MPYFNNKAPNYLRIIYMNPLRYIYNIIYSCCYHLTCCCFTPCSMCFISPETDS